MIQDHFIQRLDQALQRSVEYDLRAQVPNHLALRYKSEARKAAVLALFGWRSYAESPELLLIERGVVQGDLHSGQMAFPGGGVEDWEREQDPSGIVTALRETHEEVGLLPNLIDVRGVLPELLTYVSGYEVRPAVGILTVPIDEIILRVDPKEVARGLWIPWSEFERSENYHLEWRNSGGFAYASHVFHVAGCRVWGATGAMIRNLLDRLN